MRWSFAMFPMKAPKKKLPYIEDGGKIIPDFGFIIDYLELAYSHDLDRSLSDSDRADERALRRMIEEHLIMNYDLHPLDGKRQPGDNQARIF